MAVGWISMFVLTYIEEAIGGVCLTAALYQEPTHGDDLFDNQTHTVAAVVMQHTVSQNTSIQRGQGNAAAPRATFAIPSTDNLPVFGSASTNVGIPSTRNVSLRLSCKSLCA